MQTEENISGNGQAELVNDQEKLYPFDSMEWTVQVSRGKHVLSVVLRKPEEKDHLDFENATQSRSRVVDGAIIDQGDKHSANSDFFDRLILRGSLRRKAELEPFKQYTEDECRAFGFEVKDEIIARLAPISEVVGGEEDAGLFEQDGPISVRQIIGDADDPSYVLVYEMRPLTKSQRLDYDSAIQVKRKPQNRSLLLETETTVIRKSLKLFKSNFVSVTGGRIEAGEYSSELQNEFLGQIDGLFMFSVIDALISYNRRGRD
jgi:hypothetical protein